MAERLDRERVVKAALDLLDEVGLDGLTLRRLATELGVRAPALYWHFKNKQELLDQMADAITPPADPPAPGEGWESWLVGRARAGRAALNRHRDGAKLAASTQPEPRQFENIEMQIGVLVDAGLTAAEALSALMAIGNYVAGFTLEEQADRMRGEEPDPEHWAQALAGYPLTLAAVQTIGDPQGDASFEAGLAFFVDGIRRRITPTR